MKKPQTGKNEEMPQIVLRVTIVLAIVGSLILLVTRKDTGPHLHSIFWRTLLALWQLC